MELNELIKDVILMAPGVDRIVDAKELQHPKTIEFAARFVEVKERFLLGICRNKIWHVIGYPEIRVRIIEIGRFCNIVSAKIDLNIPDDMNIIELPPIYEDGVAVIFSLLDGNEQVCCYVCSFDDFPGMFTPVVPSTIWSQ